MRSFSIFSAAFIIITSLSSVVWAQAETRFLAVSAPATSFAENSAKPSAEGMERKVFGLLNERRRSHGLQDLVWDDDVAAVARDHSQNMASQKFFSHQGTDGSMVDDRAEQHGLINWSAIGENIAFLKGFDNPAELAVEKWMQSPSHRKNLLGPNWKESAVGVAITADGTYYLTQVFLKKN